MGTGWGLGTGLKFENDVQQSLLMMLGIYLAQRFIERLSLCLPLWLSLNSNLKSNSLVNAL